MAKTRHIHQRMSQESIQQNMLEIVKSFGVDDGDKTILNEKGLNLAITELKKISKTMQKMKSRGGLVLVENGNYEITTYELDSYKRKTIH